MFINAKKIRKFVEKLSSIGTKVSLFIDPDLKQIEVHSLPDLEARSLKSRYRQRCAPSKGPRGEPLPLRPAGGSGHAVVCGCITPVSLCLHVTLTSVCPKSTSTFLLLGILVIGFRLHLII